MIDTLTGTILTNDVLRLWYTLKKNREPGSTTNQRRRLTQPDPKTKRATGSIQPIHE
ncbi:hypothetical protein DSUL_40026 [Desulfovibrionales bacterium]